MKPNPNSMLPPQAVTWLAQRLAGHTGYVLELGSGHGSKLLANAIRPLKLISIEHDKRFLGLINNTTYIHAPIKDGWYDVSVIPSQLLIAALLVDGPPGTIGRAGLLKYPELYSKGVILIDDVHRAAELELAKQIAAYRNLPLVIHPCTNRAFATVG